MLRWTVLLFGVLLSLGSGVASAPLADGEHVGVPVSVDGSPETPAEEEAVSAESRPSQDAGPGARVHEGRAVADAPLASPPTRPPRR